MIHPAPIANATKPAVIVRAKRICSRAVSFWSTAKTVETSAAKTTR
jgi:hypothetical protein